MTKLLRKFSRNKWKSNENLSRDQYSADAITGCIRTHRNTLSVWRCNSVDFQSKDVKDLVAALASTTQHPDVIDVVLLDESELNARGLNIEASDGTTPFTGINGNHCDIVELNYEKLGEVGEYIVKQLSVDGCVKRYTKSQVIEIVKERFDANLIDLRSLSDKWSKALKD